jgi:hypothetical protein
MATNLKRQDSRESAELYMALELGNHGWKLCFSEGGKVRIKTIVAGDLEAMEQEIDKSRKRDRLIKERGAHSARIQSSLKQQLTAP